MGYAVTTPYQLFRITSGGYGASTCVLDNTDTNYSIGTLTTPDYKGIVTQAFVDLVVPAREEYLAGGLPNWITSVTSPYLGLIKGGGSTFSCGGIPDGTFYIRSGELAYGEWRVRGRTNVASHLEPNTAYTCQLMHTRVERGAPGMVLFNPTFELTLIVGEI